MSDKQIIAVLDALQQCLETTRVIQKELSDMADRIKPLIEKASQP